LKLSLIIPAFNEERALPILLNSIIEKKKADCPYELIVVNNGSTDGTLKKLSKIRGSNDWIKIVNVFPNRGYGGGIKAGFDFVQTLSTHIGWIPADGQYSFSSVLDMWEKVKLLPNAFHYGFRIKRFDSIEKRIISKIYTLLSSAILFSILKDANGLPKIFPRSLLYDLSKCVSTNFLFDVETLLKAKKAGLKLIPHKVTFYARREGVSSWSSTRLKTYFETFCGLIKLRFNSLH